MTRKELEAVPQRKNWNENTECRTLVILPQRSKHDSGYRNMAFVAGDKDNNPICRIGGGSDVIHIDGIGGYGYSLDYKLPDKIKSKSWSIDCLPKSGLLRIFSRCDLLAGDSLSSFSLYSLEGDDNQ